MKKVFTIILTVLLVFQFGVVSLASDTATISADKVSLSQEEPVLIPIKIKNNKGIMGFKITIEYPIDKLDVKSVMRGEVTSKGNFNTNFGINDGKFDVLWNNSDEIRGDGTIFVISAQANTEIKKDTEIKISFSQPDTFNLKYEDVVLNCENIIISANKNETFSETTTVVGEPTSTKEDTYLDSSQIIDAVDVTLEQIGKDKLSDVEDKDAFVEKFNENLEIITGTDKYNVIDIFALLSMYNSAYESEFLTEISDNIDFDVVNSVVKNALKEFDKDSISQLGENEKAGFIIKVEDALKAYYIDTPNISDDLAVNDALNIIEKVYKATIDTDNENNNAEKQNGQKDNSIIFVVVSATVLLITIVVIAIMIKKRKINK